MLDDHKRARRCALIVGYIHGFETLIIARLFTYVEPGAFSGQWPLYFAVVGLLPLEIRLSGLVGRPATIYLPRSV